MFATYERRRKWLPRRHHASLCMWRARAHAVKPFREMLVEYRFVINIMSNHAICGSLRRGNRRFPHLVRSETVVWAETVWLRNHWYEGFPPRAGPCCLVEERNSLTFPRFWWIWYREMELILFSNVMSTLKINFSNLFSVNKASILWPIVLELQQSKVLQKFYGFWHSCMNCSGHSIRDSYRNSSCDFFKVPPWNCPEHIYRYF